MNNLVGIIVDGDGDFASLKRRFPRGIRILKTDGPRGHAATVNDIAQKSKKQIGMLKAFKCGHAIILIDFEERVEEYRLSSNNWPMPSARFLSGSRYQWRCAIE